MTATPLRQTKSSRQVKTLLALAGGLVLAGAGTITLAAPATAAGATYYVDSVAGNDSAAGTSISTAWKSLDKINGTTFQPGDRILLKSGSTWTGKLWPKGSGTSGSPISIDAYGSGAKPAIKGAGKTNTVLTLWNQQYWEIHNLDISNQAPATSTPGQNLGDYRGIRVGGDNGKQLNHFVIDSVNVHDVTGEVNWIGGSTADNKPGINFATGWDRSKNTGGIVFEPYVKDLANPGSTATILNDITVQNSTIRNTSFAGITVKQYTGNDTGAAATGWGTRTSASDTRFAPHTNVRIRNNYITQSGTSYGANGIYLSDTRHATIENNVIDHAGTSGIEAYYADDVTVQHNEVFGTQTKAGGADSNGIDADKATTRAVIQYNFVHDNGDGLLLCQFSFGDVKARYNIITGNSRYPIYLHSDKNATAEVYNNTVYNPKSRYLVYGYGSSLAATYNLRNNVFSSTVAGASLTTSSTITYDNNFYGGATLPVPARDTHARTGDPLFTNPGVTGPWGTPATGPQLDTALAYAPRKTSPLIGAGITIADNGGHDYRGTTLYVNAPDMGAVEQ